MSRSAQKTAPVKGAAVKRSARRSGDAAPAENTLYTARVGLGSVLYASKPFDIDSWNNHCRILSKPEWSPICADSFFCSSRGIGAASHGGRAFESMEHGVAWLFGGKGPRDSHALVSFRATNGDKSWKGE